MIANLEKGLQICKNLNIGKDRNVVYLGVWGVSTIPVFIFMGVGLFVR
jgi:hypothetical protein